MPEPMTVLVAPDSFGDTLTAVAAAECIAAGWLAARAADTVLLAPQSDGGPGFVEVLASRFGTVRTTRVCGPLGAGVDARWLLDTGPHVATAYLESAQCCGLHQLGGAPTPRTALAAGTEGLGELIAAALAAGARRLVIGLGGSATSDGGAGLIGALGGPGAARELLADTEIVVASDVENPLLGPLGAASVFGPQKGADPATVTEIEDRLTSWSRGLAEIAGRDVGELPGAGAAGGLGAALLALGGHRVSGATVVAQATGQAEVLAAADLVITGEGKFDSQTLRGKVVAALTSAAIGRGVPAVVFAGQVVLAADEIADAGITGAYAIVDRAGSVELAMSDAAAQLTGLATDVAARWSAPGEQDRDSRTGPGGWE